MSKYEMYQDLDRWYKKQAIKTFPIYLFERIKQKLL